MSERIPSLDESFPDHDCPIQQFLDDPITQYYGLGGDMDEWGPLLKCAVCYPEDEYVGRHRS
jgi:hypothetical protein